MADGVVKLMRAPAAVENTTVREWAKARRYEQHLGSSVNGEAAIDWSDKRARKALLAGIVRGADRLLELSRLALGELAGDCVERQQIVAAAELLGQLLLQDVERTYDGVGLKDGVSRDRMMSVRDPEMRHGHKAAIVVDTGSQLITAVWVLPDNTPDNLGALELVEQMLSLPKCNTGVPADEVIGMPPTDTFRTKDLGPLVEGQVGGHQHGAPLVALTLTSQSSSIPVGDKGTKPSSSMISRPRQDRFRCRLNSRLSPGPPSAHRLGRQRC